MADDSHLHRHPQMPRLGDRLSGRYELTGVLGQGGSSVVYRARDERVGGEVAVKVLSPRKSQDPVFASRLRREAEILRALAHPNAVALLDVGETDTACLFLVEELLVGIDLAEALRRDGPFPPARVAAMAHQVLDVLEEAHRLGVVHRDLKPTNIMLCPTASRAEFAKVLDFGVAKAHALGPEGIHTNPGDVLFTPMYAAPELLTGGPVTGAVDVYALGLVCLELLTGEPAVNGPTVWSIVAAQSSALPIPVPGRIATHPLGGVIRRALAKRLEDRFSGAAEMRAALARIDVEPGELPPATPTALPVSEEASTPVERPRGDAAADAAGRAEAGVDDDATPIYEVPAVAQPPKPGRLRIAIAGGLILAATAATWLVLRSNAVDDGGGTRLGPAGPENAAVDGAEDCRPEDSACIEAAERACRDGDAAACERAGLALLASGDPPGADRARPLLEAACTAERPAACGALGSLYANGRGVDADAARALVLYRQACDGEVWSACAHAAAMLEQGLGAPADPAAARDLAGRACEAGQMPACAQAAGLMHRGLGGAADPAQAAALDERACDAEVLQACTGLARLWEEGSGAEPSRTREAIALYGRACDGGEPMACLRLARLAEDGLLPAGTSAAELRARACAGGYAAACSER